MKKKLLKSMERKIYEAGYPENVSLIQAARVELKSDAKRLEDTLRAELALYCEHTGKNEVRPIALPGWDKLARFSRRTAKRYEKIERELTETQAFAATLKAKLEQLETNEGKRGTGFPAIDELLN